jgi:hypothetical protein
MNNVVGRTYQPAEGVAVFQSFGVLGMLLVCLPMCGLFVAHSSVSGRGYNNRNHPLDNDASLFLDNPDIELNPAVTGEAASAPSIRTGRATSQGLQLRVHRALSAARTVLEAAATASGEVVGEEDPPLEPIVSVLRQQSAGDLEQALLSRKAAQLTTLATTNTTTTTFEDTNELLVAVHHSVEPELKPKSEPVDSKSPNDPWHARSGEIPLVMPPPDAYRAQHGGTVLVQMVWCSVEIATHTRSVRQVIQHFLLEVSCTSYHSYCYIAGLTLKETDRRQWVQGSCC